MLGRVQGLGIEPESFKEYTEGDDLRFLDWNAFARLDDLTIRTFRAEREIEVSILVDASASMGLPREDDKLGFALGLATDDCQKTYETLRARGVEFNEEPTERFYGIDCGLRDPFGNHLRLTQPAPGPIVVPDPAEFASG